MLMRKCRSRRKKAEAKKSGKYIERGNVSHRQIKGIAGG
jgi:hypothetical protein